jgi:lysophospholipase L1-like esterase
VDLLPAFEATGSSESLYFRNDFHLTASGHQLAARIIDPVLQAQLRAFGKMEGSKGP